MKLAYIGTAFVLFALPAYAQRPKVRCIVNAPSVVRDGQPQTLPEGTVVRLEATTTSSGKLVGFIMDFERERVLGWIDRAALTCSNG